VVDKEIPEQPVKNRGVSRRGYIALTVSALIAAFLWYVMADGTHLFASENPTQFPLPSPFSSAVFWVFYVVPLAIPTAIVLDIVGGLKGGPNRVVSVIGGVLLSSPAIYVAVILLSSGINPFY
jgi:hypothetical protein